MSSLNRVQYAGLDFDTYEDEILARLQVKYASSYNDFVVSSLGIMLIDIFAYGLDTLAFYLDRRATDNFLSTARTRKSVARAARQLGYKMGPAVASSVDLSITPTPPTLGSFTFDVNLPIGFRFKGPNGLTFEAQQAFVWPKNVTPATAFPITCSEGITSSATFTSTGLANQVFQISNVPQGKFIVGPGTNGQSKTVVTVNGVTWTESELLSFGTTNQFEVGYNDTPPTLRFGDGVAGNIPATGASIVVSYFASTGVAGQVTQHTIQSVDTPLVVNLTNITLVIDNPNASNGGGDPESIESAKANAPTVFKSRGVNITAEDYQARAGTFRDATQGAIAVAQAITVKNTGDDAYLTGQLTGITSSVEEVQTSIDGVIAELVGATSSPLNVILSDANAINLSGVGLLALLNADLADILTASQSIKTSLDGIRSAGAQITTASTNLNSLITALPTGTPSQLTAGDSAAILADIAVILAGAGGVDVTAVATQNQTIQTKQADALVQSAAVQTTVADIITQQGLAVTDVNSFSTTIGTLVADIGSVTVDGYVKNINDHVNAFLSADCKANLIEVPVLTIDADGFYAVPTNGLMKSLQTYLDAKKEVSQVVKVFGASDQLARVWLAIKIVVLPGYVEQTVQSLVEAAILNVLKGRAFGASLYLDELYGPVAPSNGAIPGLATINIQIVPGSSVTGTGSGIYDINGLLIQPLLLDSDGNLPIGSSEVVTRGLSSASLAVTATILT